VASKAPPGDVVTELSHIYTEDMPILGWSNGQTSLGRLMVLGEAPPPDLCGQPPSMVGAEAVALGIFVPFFFVTSGITFNLDALGSVEAIAKLFMFFALFLVVRGVPALLLYRGVLSMRDRAALAFYSATELPLVVAITTIATKTGHMRTSTAAGLVGAAMLSTLVYPFVGRALRSGARSEEGAPLAESQPAA